MSKETVSSSQTIKIDYIDWSIFSDEEPLPTGPMAALDKLTQLNGSNASAGAYACGAARTPLDSCRSIAGRMRLTPASGDPFIQP